MDRPRRDPTANAAIGNVMREQRRKRRRDAAMKQDLNPCTNCGRMVGPFDIAEVGAVGANIDGGDVDGT